MPDSGTSTSQSLERGLAILSSFNSDRPLIGVSELSRELELSRSTAHRYIATLAQLGYLQQDPDSKRYRLGPKVLDLGFSAINSMDVREISAPHLRQLSDETGHTVNLAILDGTDVVYIERCRTARPGQREIDLNLHVGARLPAYCTAMGKAILAFVPEERREEIIARIDFAPRGPNTLTDPAGVPGGARADPAVGHRRERRGARLRPAVDRRPDPVALGRGARRAQPRRPPHDGVDGRADRALRPRRHADGARHLARHGAQAGARLMAVAGRDDRGVLWTPPPDVRETTEIGRYLAWLERERGLTFAGYDELQRWSVDDLAGFWSSIWDFFEVKAHAPYSTVLASDAMPGAVVVPGRAAQLRRAPRRPRRGRRAGRDRRPLADARPRRAHVRRLPRPGGARAGRPRSGSASARETGSSPTCRTSPRRSSRSRRPRASARSGRAARPSSGRAASSTASAQLEPTVLLTVGGYGFRDRSIDRRDEVAAIRAALPTLRHVVHVPYGEHVVPDALSWGELLAEPGPLEFAPVAFDHPLFVLFSSGTTGKPKAIVHGHGGILLELSRRTRSAGT